MRFKNFLLTSLFILALVVSLLSLWILPVRAQTPTPGNPVYIYLFWGEGCPHCAKAKPYFENLAVAHPEIVLKSYEVYYDPENQSLFALMAQQYGIEQFAVPTIFIGPYHLQGYAEELNPDIESVVLQCIQQGCVDPGLGVIKPSDTMNTPNATESLTTTPSQPPVETITPLPTPITTATPLPVAAGISPAKPSGSINQSYDLDVPLLGKVNLASQSTLISTMLIAVVDGFNPCSLWVLTMLLALTLHTGSRKKVFIIGLVFLTVSAGIYALFIAGLFSVLKIASFMGWIRILVALIALVFAIVNIKDYFWYKEGISFTIADEKKSGIFKKMRTVIDASQSFTGLVGATIALAAGVSLVEFSCTAGFPVVWTNIIATQHISGAAFVLLLILYMVIYQLDEMVIFFTSVATLKASRVEEKHGRVIKLISGVLMLTLSFVMLFNPALMNNLGSSLIIFGIAFGVSLLVLFVHRILLQKFGIQIGTEPSRRTRTDRYRDGSK
jgi:thiol-disulfide isomerase/thioredoxin